MNFKKYLSSVFFSTARCAKKLWVMVFFAALIGCGGGGTSSPSPDNELPSPVAGGIDDNDELIPDEPGQPPVTPGQEAQLPTINVGGSQYADPNVLVTLNATVDAAAGAEIVRTLWTQVSGPSVRIPNPSALNNLVLMPDVAIATPVEFRFTALDDQGRINSATLLVLVKPVPIFVRVIGGVFNESEEQAIVTIRLNAATETPVTAIYSTREGTASSELDFIPTSGEIIFEPGVVEQTITIDLIDDEITELDEIFNLYVTATIGTETFANSGVVIIRNGTEPTEAQQIEFSNAGPITIFEGEEYVNPLNPEVVPAGTGDVIYSSSNSSVASVDSSGVITAVSVGVAQITVMKMADEVYRTAEDSFELQIVSRGTPPSVSILYSNGEGTSTATADTVLSVQVEDTLDLTCDVQDEEDGEIPNPDTGEPPDAVTWISNIDAVLGIGRNLDVTNLSQGQHSIACRAIDSDRNVSEASITVLVGNIAPQAFISGFPALCPDTSDEENCYSLDRINDSDLSTARGGLTSWTHTPPRSDPVITLSWSSGFATINQIDLYTTEGFPIKDYTIEYFDGETWNTIVSIDGNTDVIRSHTFPAVETSEIRFIVRSGPDIEPELGRINELVVWGSLIFPT